MLFGAIDYYGRDDVPAMQLLPYIDRQTADIPDMARPFTPLTEPVWQWLSTSWSYPIPSTSTATTNLDALKGARITEASRWEDGHWELFAGPGPNVPPEEVRTVPLGTLLALDKSLLPVVYLEVGKSLWRPTDDAEWEIWA